MSLAIPADSTASIAGAPAQAAVLAPLAGLPFAKGHGTGNDFILVADPDGAREITAEVR